HPHLRLHPHLPQSYHPSFRTVRAVCAGAFQLLQPGVHYWNHLAAGESIADQTGTLPACDIPHRGGTFELAAFPDSNLVAGRPAAGLWSWRQSLLVMAAADLDDGSRIPVRVEPHHLGPRYLLSRRSLPGRMLGPGDVLDG